MADSRDAVVIEPTTPADAAVVWLHGLGADGHDFEPIVPLLGASNTRHIRFIFPHAPQIPVTINGGIVMRAWYDVLHMDITRRADEGGVRSSEAILKNYIEEQVRAGIPIDRIVAAGFSQGGAVALHTGLRHPQALAGILALSCYLPVEHAIRDEINPANRTVPVFMAHGTHDPVIPVRAGERSKKLIEELGFSVSWHTYPIPHTVSPEEIQDIADWLSAVLP